LLQRQAEGKAKTPPRPRRRHDGRSHQPFLFSKPAHELDREGEEVEPNEVRALADHLQQRLRETADALEKLTTHGWEATMMLYDICLSHPYINTEAEARGRIEDMGLNPDDFCFMEFDDEEEWDEEDLDEDEEFSPEEFGGEFEPEDDSEAKEP
jgi:hypothetical protein